MNRIWDLVKKYNLYLLSDEVYREFIYTGSPYISAMHLEGIEQNVVLIDSVSKRYSECVIRIGVLITKNEKVRNTVMKFCQARLSPPLIGQLIAEASIEGTVLFGSIFGVRAGLIKRVQPFLFWCHGSVPFLTFWGLCR